MRNLIATFSIYGFTLFSFLTGCGPITESNMDSINLAGTWQFRIDSLDIGIDQKWYNSDFDDTVKLPGSLTENGKGYDVNLNTKWTGSIVDRSWYTDEKYAKYRQPGNIKIPFWLQPEKHYIGVAWYKKEVEIPESWIGKPVELFLERCHWETTIWIDGRKAGMQNHLGAPHIFDLSECISSPGKHTLAIRIDNRIRDIDPGQNAHSVSDHTQTNWNGIVGEMKLGTFSPIYFEKVKVYPDIQGKKIRIIMAVINKTGVPQTCTMRLAAKHPDHQPGMQEQIIDVAENRTVEIEYSMGDNPLLWDEFHPNVYTLNLVLDSPVGQFQQNIDFGMREFKVSGTRFAVNGRPVFLRGTLECAIFPKTGYPSTDAAEWQRIFKIMKMHGMNHMRFHSWCPPKAAFIAADEAGVYLQVECSAWAKIGDGESIDQWLYGEAETILDNYGNHPSFCMMAYGNEPAGENQGEYLSKFVSHWKENDPRRVYTSGAGWPPVPEMDYYNPMDPRIQRWGEGLRSIINREAPQTMFDFRDILEEKFPDKPVVSHEIGQWCVYPNFAEIKKYTGVLKPENFEIFRETLSENGMGHLEKDFLNASGKLQALCYKADIEAALRTPGMAGFQLLDLHDFPGQGTALVGVLDAFWGEKGYISPAEFSRFCNSTVPLARLKKRVFLSDDMIEATIEVAHFGPEVLKSVVPSWAIKGEDGTILWQGQFERLDIPVGNSTLLGTISVSPAKIDRPRKLVLTITIDKFSNHWDLWVYPAKLPQIPDVLVTSVLDDSAKNVLENGGNVLLSLKKGSLKSEKGGAVKVGFSSIFWNTAWTNKQAPHTLGVLCDPKHPALSEFPTESHSNWQWWDAMSYSHAINLKSFAAQPEPIVRIIDDWFENLPLALIFEVKAGNGKILVSGIDCWKDMDKRPEARQLFYSLKKYMGSDFFNPEMKMEVSEISALIKDPAAMSQAVIIQCDSEVPGFEAANILDDDPETIWHTPWDGDISAYPHTVDIDLGGEMRFNALKLVPRQDGITGGWISEAEFYISPDGKSWGKPVANGKFKFDKKEKIIRLDKEYSARYIRLVALKGFQDQEFSSLAELKLIMQ